MSDCKQISEHYSNVWSSPARALRWDRGPLEQLPADFSVLQLKRAKAMWAFATCCMSQPEDAERLELHLLSADPGHAAQLTELMTVVAHFHRTGARLGLGHTVNFGRPWVPGSTCTHGLISLPYLDGPRLEWLDTPRVRFLWLVPITPGELAYKKQHGLEALEERLEEHPFDYLDPRRPSVA